ncbi:MAG: 30S ribosomal protein S6 [Patescibacteria group bacterium]
MRNYDLSLIFSPLLSDEEANDLFQQFVSFVQEQGGILEDQRILGKKPLLAPIRHFKEGYLAVVAFSLNEEKLPFVEKKCRETEQILRFFIARQAKKVKKARVALTPKTAPIETQKKEEKIDLKDIDEKLEEIFK